MNAVNRLGGTLTAVARNLGTMPSFGEVDFDSTLILSYASRTPGITVTPLPEPGGAALALLALLALRRR